MIFTLMRNLWREITILIHTKKFYKYLVLRFCLWFIWFLDGVLLKGGSQFLKWNCRKFWTRNRPGDRMRDRYNLNTLPGGSEHELAEFGKPFFFDVWYTVSCTFSFYRYSHHLMLYYNQVLSFIDFIHYVKCAFRKKRVKTNDRKG